ncbi:MAG TPA: MBL fold metallo-hydrolase [Gemmataceae bacterium]|nr:MBL fold metallo-hydrolase [Gemmataceae bacterium]
MSHIVKAASVLLARNATAPELYVVRRAEALRFFGGFMAFPGGKVHAGDQELVTAAAEPASDRYITAARELFEETGVLLARKSDGTFPPSGSVLNYLRRKMAREDLPFSRVLQRLEAYVRAEDFFFAGQVTTPPFVPTRFDTAFFVARLPENQSAEVWEGELVEGRWAAADEAVEYWTRGEWLLSPPTVAILQAIRGQSLEDIPQTLSAALSARIEYEIHPIFFAPRVQMIPLDTHSLPPSTHTNAYLVGSGPVYLIDPGTALPPEQERLFALLDAHQARGPRLTAVVLTHHHPDHIGAAATCAIRYNVPIYAHAKTAEKLRGKVPVDRFIEDGDRLDLGAAPDGSGAWHLEALHTPGHAGGHLAFYERRYRLLFVGDMISTLSSVIIAPPDGDLAEYLLSLQRLRGYDCRLLLPAHGSPSARPGKTIDDCIAHRMRRQNELVAALNARPRAVADLAVELYKGLAPALMRFAELQVLAGLKKLQHEGRAVSTGAAGKEEWSLAK